MQKVVSPKAIEMNRYIVKPLKISYGPFPLGTQKRLRVDSQAVRRTKCCESDSFSAPHPCWVLDSVSPTSDAQPTLSTALDQ